jgi:lysophospholipase L1-like esterase
VLALGVLGATLWAWPAAAAAATFQYVALGDSVAAGEGLQNLPGQNPCHRSTHSYPYLIAANPALHIASFKSLACTGASTSQVLDHSESVNGAVIPAQVPRATASQPSIVTMTAGQDDIQGWGKDVAVCLKWGLNRCVRFQGDVDNAVNDVAARIPTIVARLRRAGATQILITGYYDPFPSRVPPAAGSSCDSIRRFFLGQRLNDHTIQLLRDYLGEINGAISAAARRSGATYVNLETMIPEANRVCSASPWVFSFNPGFVRNLSAFHPTAPGQRRIAQLVAAKIAPVTNAAHEIAFLGQQAGTTGVYMMSTDGSGVTLLPGTGCSVNCDGVGDTNPQPVAWSSNHTNVAYINPNRPPLFTINWASATGSTNRAIAQTVTPADEVAVSPDSTLVAFIDLDQETTTPQTVLHWEVMLAHTDGSGASRMTDLPANCMANGLRWMPNGTHLIVGLQCANAPDESFNQWSVVSISTNGGALFGTILGSQSQVDYRVGDVSPDGSTILLVSGGDVVSVPAGGGPLTTVVSGFPDGFAASWVAESPDGSRLVIGASSFPLQTGAFFVASSDGSGLTQLPVTPLYESADW